MKSGIAIFVVIAVLANIFAALWLIWWTNRGVKVAPQETTHIWDDDLTEYNNPMPRWWLWLFILSIVFAFAYLALFPGLGNYRGLLSWTSVSQFTAEDTAAQSAFERRFAAEKGKSLLALSKDPAAMTTARNLFALNCSSCHGSDARGAKGFPNLTDQDWLWGGSEETVYQTIAQGRNNAMPGWGPVLGADGVEQVMAYVLSLSGRHLQGSEGLANFVAAGKVRFTTMCSACHGVDGKGNQALGAPNLTDSVWLHGGSADDIRETIAKGRSNAMPSHLERLGDTKVRLLAAYVLSLSRTVAAAPRTAAAAPLAAAASGEAHAAE
jgi:cytochrome c oxidase cbb3-type subunit 3